MDWQTFDTLYQTIYQAVHSFLLSITKNPAEADDLTQEAFLKYYRSADKFRNECSELTMLCQFDIATSGGIYPIGGDFEFGSTGTIQVGESVDEIYVLTDNIEDEWYKYRTFMNEKSQEEREKILEVHNLDNVTFPDTYLLPTDGYDFSKLGNKVLLWKRNEN